MCVDGGVLAKTTFSHSAVVLFVPRTTRVVVRRSLASPAHACACPMSASRAARAVAGVRVCVLCCRVCVFCRAAGRRLFLLSRRTLPRLDLRPRERYGGRDARSAGGRERGRLTKKRRAGQQMGKRAAVLLPDHRHARLCLFLCTLTLTHTPPPHRPCCGDTLPARALSTTLTTAFAHCPPPPPAAAMVTTPSHPHLRLTPQPPAWRTRRLQLRPS